MEYVQSLSVSDASNNSRGWRKKFAGLLSSIRFQLLGGVLFSAVAPAVSRKQFETVSDTSLSYEHSVLGTAAALLFGYLLLRKLTVLPGAKAIMSIVPAFLTSYAVIVAAFFLMRLDYSRAQFLMSFVLTCAWFAGVLYLMPRLRRSVFAILPGTDLNLTRQYKGIKWKVLESHVDLRNLPNIPIIVDFRSNSLDDEWERLIAEESIKGRRVISHETLKESLSGRVDIGRLNENPWGHLAPDSLYSPAKRYIDIVSALFLLIALWPILIIVGVIVRMESAGPAIYKQKRMGFQGRSFTVFKFRSMRVQSEKPADVDSDKTLADDDRITRFGRFIRQTRLDELPQILNILKGDMSWIGPRPETLRLSEWYENEIPFYRYRHIVRPGISGWAQVKQGHVTEVEDIRHKLEYDMYYIKNFSLWLDLLIVFKTLSVIFTGKGAR